jgi:hypothetical protein
MCLTECLRKLTLKKLTIPYPLVPLATKLKTTTSNAHTTDSLLAAFLARISGEPLTVSMFGGR